MKRIIDGVTYNTDTATAVARWEYEDENGYDTEAVLYQTRGGAFFIVHSWNTENKPKVYFESINRESIARLVERTDNLTIINEDILSDPPEATAEQSPGATLYLRIPSALKDQAESSAKSDGLSVNAWAMRCIERCAQLDEIGARLGEIMQTCQSHRAGFVVPRGGPSMLEHVNEQAEEIARLLGWRGKDLENLANNAAHDAATAAPGFHQRWPHPDEIE